MYNSCCSVILPIGYHIDRSNFLKYQGPVIRMERSDRFSRFKVLKPAYQQADHNDPQLGIGVIWQQDTETNFSAGSLIFSGKGMLLHGERG